ncbi:MAG TPA: nucleotidyltransferase family protein [Candidatus Eremiobacteraceae bacterium]|nr:nucleotidyltransferase family protein [Candidatus Eremiobacteraceae bacterium]
MKAMILAAGLGTRLRPLTNDRPKALVEVGGRTMLEITLSRLRQFGVREVIVNVHHLAEMVIDYLKANQNFGMYIEISHEEVVLDTGGGLKKAAQFLKDPPPHSKHKSFILHNVDVLSTIDLGRMVEFHSETGALATLAVRDRETSRYLVFDAKHQLCGRRAGHDQTPELVRPAAQAHSWAFSGIHVISPHIFELITEEGAFSIINSYLRLAAQGENIVAFRDDKYYWRDLGRPENLKRAERDFQDKILS